MMERYDHRSLLKWSSKAALRLLDAGWGYQKWETGQDSSPSANGSVVAEHASVHVEVVDGVGAEMRAHQR